MKEEGIRKLKNILNEYEDYKEEKYGKRDYKWICYGKENPRISADRTEGEGVNNCLYEDESRAIIICKGYNFIKWLVENDKIDFDKVMKMGKPCFVRYDKGEIICVHDVDFDGQLIMLLSISDSPIEDLIYFLK